MEPAIRVTPFGFDRVFHFAATDPAEDAELSDAEAQVIALHAEIRRLEDAHQFALDVAHGEGFHAGLQEAREERDAALLVAIDAMQDLLGDVDARLIDAIDAMTQDAAAVALAAAEALAGHVVSVDPAMPIDAALGRVLLQVARGTQLDIHVNPVLADAVERSVAARKAQERRKLCLTVIADPAIAPGDARILWEEGGVAVDAAARRQAVLAEMAPLLQPVVAG